MPNPASFRQFAASRTPALSEGSIYERLRRDPNIEVDPFIFHASLIYDEADRKALAQIHRDYIDVALRADMAMMTFTDTWRANFERIAQSGCSGLPVNQDNAEFMREIIAGYASAGSPIYIGGQIGPRGDAYAPGEALDEDEAALFHKPQLDALAEGGVDFLFAATLPAASEARGIARAMAETTLPYALSYVVRADATLLDGTPMGDLIEEIDNSSGMPPVGHSVNCVHPRVLHKALSSLKVERPNLLDRLLSFHANTSDLDPDELDCSEELQTADPDALSTMIATLQADFGIPVLGGCCGTDASHIGCLAIRLGGLQYREPLSRNPQ